MTYDSRVEDCFRLRYKNGKELQFQNSGDGLYTFVDPKCNEVFRKIKFNDKKGETKMNIQQSEVKDCKQCLHTVNKNEKLMTKKEIDSANAALDLQEYLG